MRRVVSLFLPTWPCDRVRKKNAGAPPRDRPMVTVMQDAHVVEAVPQEDEAALEQLGLWCTRYSPLVTPDPPDGIFIDIAGSAHLFKGETALLQDIASRLAAAGINGKVAVADTPGCGGAVTRFLADALGRLPVSARWRAFTVWELIVLCVHLANPLRPPQRIGPKRH